MTRPHSVAARRGLYYGIATLVFLLDQLTKSLVQAHVSTWDTLTIIPGFFDIIHTENPGAAFSFLAASQSEWRSFFLIGLTAAASVLMAVLLWRPSGRLGDSRMLRLGLALCLGGALGNVYDRVTAGVVTDFLDFYVNGLHWPAFNVADSALTVGAALVILAMARSKRPEAKS
jgi:signal peptidase II